MCVHKVEVPTESSVALCSPGDALLRHFFLEVQEGVSEYQLSWRQQNVPMRIGSIDASMKRGKGLADLNKRQTVRRAAPAHAPPSSLPRPPPPPLLPLRRGATTSARQRSR